MTRLLSSAAAIALFAANPAAAQLLGGGAGGALGGTLGGLGGAGGGALGGMGAMGDTLGRAGSDTTLRSTRSTRVDRSVDRRSGRVSASGSHSGDTSIANGSTIAGRTLDGNGALAGSGSGGVDAQLVGTDTLRAAGDSATGSARGVAQSARSTAAGARNAAGTTAGYAGAATANGGATGAASGTGGMLALAGSTAANGAGSFDVSPGMVVNDARGHAIGTVRDVRTAADGAVHTVVMQVGDRTATLPAANFTGSGSVLVSAMGKGEVKDAAKDQATD